MENNMDLDAIVKSISKLPYSDLRVLAESLTDVIVDNFKVAGLDSDHLVPVLFNWSQSWEGTNDA